MKTELDPNTLENKFQKVVLIAAATIVVATFAYSWVCEIVIKAN